MKKYFTINLISYFIFITLAISLVSFIILQNLSPFGTTISYSLSDSKKNISEPGPKDRVVKENVEKQTVYKQKDDFIYFETQMPFKFDRAKTKVTFFNPYRDQRIYLGFHDKKEWHYDTKLISAPMLDSLSWNKVGADPILYEKNKKYESISKFLENPPDDKIIGIYAYDQEIFNKSRIELTNYMHSSSETVIDAPLREKQILYVYLKDEPFKMTFTKQDLNWYKDPDPVTINVYKDADRVYSVTIDDDGIVDNSGKILPPQKITVQNPGPELPENGVYKIVIDGSGDTIIKKISTNLNKIVFEGPLFLAGNKDVYGKVIGINSPTELFTNARVISAKTYHTQAFQNINIGGQKMKIATRGGEVMITTKEPFTSIAVPENDIILNGTLGYFSFKKNQFFEPSLLKIIPITSEADLKLVDYIFSNYSIPRKENGLQTAEKEFDLSSAVINNRKLSWIIKSPGIKEYDREVQIYNIEITFYKNPIDIKHFIFDIKKLLKL